MNLDARIRRRRRAQRPRLVRDYRALSPVAHVDEPADRGPVFEQLLDHLDPVFDGQLPPNAYVHGPPGVGKSAIITALVTHLDELSTETTSAIQTATRAASATTPEFIYIDMREVATEFSFYRNVLDALVEESVPHNGVSTDEIRSRLHDLTVGWQTGAVVAVDHADDADGPDPDALVDLFAGLPSNVSWLAIGRAPPAETPLSEYTAASIQIDSYRPETLIDVLTARASEGLVRGTFDYDLARRVVDWADGNAHDGLTALFIAADSAERAGRSRLTEADVEDALAEIPRPAVSLGRVLALSASKQAVLRELVDLDGDERASVTATTEAISARPGIDFSTGTVKRFLYEIAETGIIERVRSDATEGKGRPPSRVELRFSPTAFRRLYDLRQDSTTRTGRPPTTAARR